jgi:signal transduction histidine kinase
MTIEPYGSAHLGVSRLERLLLQSAPMQRRTGPETLDSNAPVARLTQQRQPPPLDAAQRRTFHVAIGAAIGLLSLVTIVALLPGERILISNSTLDIVLNTLTAVAAAGAAALAWLRYRIEDDVSAVFESAAFLVLCATRSLIVAIAAFGRPDDVGMGLDAPQQWPLYALSLARLASAVLLVMATVATLRRIRVTRIPVLLLEVGPLALLLVCFGLLATAETSLAPVLGPAGFAALRGDPSAQPGMEPIGWLIQAVVAAAYLFAAAGYRRIAEQRGLAYARYLTIALVVAGFSQVHWSLFPGIYRPLVTVDDLLRAVFSVILLTGIGAQFSGDLLALRSANARLRALRTADAERLALEARARLAREIHDGLAQDLWLAKLKQARLDAMTTLPDDARELVAEVGGAVDRALSNARSVVETMRLSSPGRTLDESIQRVVSEFEAESGIRADVAALGGLPHLDPNAEDELLRILREALVNVERHADATVVRVSAGNAGDGATFELRVTDNGRGFDIAGVEDDGSFGIRGMRERAELLGGMVQVSSRPADGTTVAIRLPATA